MRPIPIFTIAVVMLVSLSDAAKADCAPVVSVSGGNRLRRNRWELASKRAWECLRR
jgi:hypothetical protein